MFGLFNENGPCEAIEVAQGKFGTIPRDWGWDRGSNMLYIDQVRRFSTVLLNTNLEMALELTSSFLAGAWHQFLWPICLSNSMSELWPGTSWLRMIFSWDFESFGMSCQVPPTFS